MVLHGWGLSPYEHAVCGRDEGLTVSRLRSGGVVRSDCTSHAVAYPAPETIELFGLPVLSHWDVAGTAAEHDRRAVSIIVGAYSQWYIERKVHSLRTTESA